MLVTLLHFPGHLSDFKIADAEAIAIAMVTVRAVATALAGAGDNAPDHDGGDAGYHPNTIRLPTSYNLMVNLSQSSFTISDKYINVPMHKGLYDKNLL